MAVQFPILTTADFPNLILKDEGKTRLTTFILEREKHWVKTILSGQAYEDIVAGSAAAKYTELFDETIYTDSNNDKQVNAGMTAMLKYFIEAEFSRTQLRNSVVGRTKNLNDNAQLGGDAQNTSIVYSIYNKGIEIYENDILPFIYDKMNETNYEGYEDFILPDLKTAFL